MKFNMATLLPAYDDDGDVRDTMLAGWVCTSHCQELNEISKHDTRRLMRRMQNTCDITGFCSLDEHIRWGK